VTGMVQNSAADRTLPAGRLAGFEDDEAFDMTSILGRRTSPAEPQHPATPKTTAPTPRPAPAKTPTTARKKATPTKVADTAPVVRAPRNRMRSSSMHIRSSLVEQIVHEREKTGRSNGNIIIAALETCQNRFAELLPPVSPPTGGSLFAARATHAPRTDEGPYSPLNVRLYEADFTVLDQLVSTYGARSRSHLVDTALAYYFHHNH